MASDTMFSIGTPGSNPFGDLSTMLERFEVPGVDMSSFIDARRRDVQALVAEALSKLLVEAEDVFTLGDRLDLAHLGRP